MLFLGIVYLNAVTLEFHVLIIWICVKSAVASGSGVKTAFLNVLTFCHQKIPVH